MNKIKTVVVGSAMAVTVAAGMAHAGNPVAAPADPVITPPAAPAVSFGGDWTGAYVGADLGWGTQTLGGVSGDGINGGAFLGYDYDFGNAVVGGELQYLTHDVTIGGTSLDSMARAKARLGYDAGPALVYATAGYAWADSSIGDGDGYVAGIGMEYRLNNGLSVGAEYLHNEFSNFGGSGNTLSGDTVEARISFRF